MTPYFEDDAVTIYHGDCREILPTLVGPIHALITDPPYGVELGTGDLRGNGHGLGKLGYDSYDDTLANFQQVVIPVIAGILGTVRRAAVFAGKHVTLFPAPSAVGGVYCPSAVGRNAWGYANLAAVFFYGSDPKLHLGADQSVLSSTETAESNGHPCPKPLGWMRWLVNKVALEGETILDPFMGSGTTLRAAKDLGRKAIGIEIEERYCEIAARRMAQGVLL